MLSSVQDRVVVPVKLSTVHREVISGAARATRATM